MGVPGNEQGWSAKVKLMSTCFTGFILASWLGQIALAQSLGHSFLYQGYLEHDGATATGTYDLRFELFDASEGGSQRGGTLLLEGWVLGADGLLSLPLDFGDVFGGEERWLEVAIFDSTTESFTVLGPRQRLAPTPYAHYAVDAAHASTAMDAEALGGVPASNYLTTSGGMITGGLTVGGGLSSEGELEGASAAIGETTEVIGVHSMAVGEGVTANAATSVAFGRYKAHFRADELTTAG